MHARWMFAGTLAVLAVAACDGPTPTSPAAAGAAPSAVARDAAASLARNPAALAFAPGANPYGDTLVTWSERWWQWALAFPASASPALDQTGRYCAEGQSGPVWFMETEFGSGPVTRTCTVPAHTALLVNLSGILNDYPCPFPGFGPAPGQSLQDFLTQGAEAVVNGVSSLTLTVDGDSVPGLFAYRVTTPLFEFTGDASLATVLDPCIQGTPQPAVSDGFFLMLKPLPAGAHTVTYTASDVMGNFSSVTLQLSVR